MAQWIIAKITRLSSVEESSARLFRQSKMTSILIAELHGSPLSPSAHPHVLAANACTFHRSDVSQFEKSKWVNFLISFIADVRTVVVQLIIFLFYWSGAKNNLPPGILNLFHRLESMRTLRICKCIFKLDNERLRSVFLFLCACKPCCSVNDLTMETKSKWIHAQGPEEFENLSSLSLRAKKDSLVPSTLLILIILALNFRSWRYIPQC